MLKESAWSVKVLRASSHGYLRRAACGRPRQEPAACRGETHTLVILSPHRDDAAFSCGIAMHLALGAGLAVSVVNVFTRSDYAPFCETAGLEGISALRREEDARLAELLGAGLRLIDLHWLDAPLRHGLAAERSSSQGTETPRFQAEVAQLATDLEPLLTGRHCVLLPLANEHYDHKLVRAAAERCVQRSALGYYEDLPYFARLSESARRTTLAALVPEETTAVRLHHPEGAAVKHRLASCYPSQVEGGTVAEMAEYAADRTGTRDGGADRRAGAELFYAGDDAARKLLTLRQPGPARDQSR